MKLKFLFVILILLCLPTLYGQEQLKIADSIFKTRGEVYISVPLSSYKSTVPSKYSDKIDNIRKDSVYLYLSPDDRDLILAAPPGLNILEPPSEAFFPRMSESPNEVLTGKAYPTYPAYLDIMKNFNELYPDLCIIDTIGFSVEGRLILAARIGLHLNNEKSYPVAFYSSSMHGDELTGFSLMLRLIDTLLNSSPEGNFPAILSQMTVIVNPLANPDGTYFYSDTTVYGAKRFNAANVDLNRNFPDILHGDHPDGNEWQVETVAMMDYMKEKQPVLLANFHGGAEVLNYPFDTWPVLHADDNWFRFVAGEYAGEAKKIDVSYMSEFVNGITNGYQWYEVDGSRQDYVTYFLHGREITIELSNVKMPHDSLLNYFWRLNKNSLINLLWQTTYGINGTVRDSVSSLPLKAEIYIVNHDTLNSRVYTNDSGYFFRPLYEGVYDISVSSEGYQKVILKNQSVANYNSRVFDIRLKKEPEIDFSVTVGPNPFVNDLHILIESDSDMEIAIEMLDLKGRKIYTKYTNIIAGTNDLIIKPFLVESGVYILRLKNDRLLKQFKVVFVN